MYIQADMHAAENERASERAAATATAGHAEVNGGARASDFSAQKAFGVGVSLDTSFDALAARALEARSLRRTCEQVKSRVSERARLARTALAHSIRPSADTVR